MQFKYAFSELGSGLRRNLTMTIAVIVTVWVSLVLFGVGLLLRAEVDLAKGHWYDKVEISVYLCNETDAKQKAGRCASGPVTDGQRSEIEQALEDNDQVQKVYFETQKQAFDKYRKIYKDAASTPYVKAEHMQSTFRVALQDPQQYEGVVSAVSGLPGVHSVQDSRDVLEPLFRGLNGLQWLSIGLSVGLLVAGVLQIGNTIRLTVFSRRREIGIMRLVGASNFYIQLPFIVEAVVAALIGAGLACLTIAATPFVTDRLREAIKAVPWIGWEETLAAMPLMAGVGVLLAIGASFVTLRRHLEV